MTNDEKALWTKFGFRQSIDDLAQYGPSASAMVAPSPYAKGDRRFPVLAQIDTGAAGTAISPRLVQALNLEPIGYGEVHEAGWEPTRRDLFALTIFLADGQLELDLNVAGLSSLGEPHHLLVGRDALARFRLLVDFTTGVTQLHLKSDLA